MLVLNLGLQGCALARKEMDTDFETIMRKCNGMKSIRRAAEESHLGPKTALEGQSPGYGAPSTSEEIGANVL